jgi:hypothetical protein
MSEGWCSFSIRASTKRRMEELRSEMEAESFDEVIRRLIKLYEEKD